MRTVTFSDPKVSELIKTKFVATWFNYQPGFHSCERKQEIDIITQSPDGFGTRNWYSLFLTPDGRLLHALPGYWSPKQYVEQLQFVADLWEQVRDETGSLKRDADRIFKRAHRARWDGCDKECLRVKQIPAGKSKPLDSRKYDYFAQTLTSEELERICTDALSNHHHDSSCKDGLERELMLMKSIHRDLSIRGLERLTDRRVENLPSTTPFEDKSSTRPVGRSPSLEHALTSKPKSER